ncbi:hypothetical protein ACVITL_006355 [Rhizobium pisi]
MSPVSSSTITAYAATPTNLSDMDAAIFSAEVAFEAWRISPGTRLPRFFLYGTIMYFRM